MYDRYQHPAVTRAEREGVPLPTHTCVHCGEDIGEYVFTIDDAPHCAECFADWVKDYLSTNPREVAAALDVPVRYMG